MNTLKQMGIQQWRLKPGFVNQQAVSAPPAPVIDLEIETEQELESQPPQEMGSSVLPQLSDSPIVANVAEQKPEMPESVAANTLIGQLDWRGLQALVNDSKHCPSCDQANSLLGAGDLQADCLFVVDAPNQAELQEGQLLVGRAGRLFDAMLRVMGLSRGQIYVSSVFKCAPSKDLSRSPQCDGVIRRQLELLEPKVVVTFGEFVAQKVIRANEPLVTLRQSKQQCHQSKVPIVPTHSPAEMLSQPSLKALAWHDLKRAMTILNS